MQKSKIKAYIMAARLRTLPLSVSGILVGTAMAVSENAFCLPIFIGALLTTISLQVLSNFANDYGDGVKGTDNEHRIGPKRAVQSGMLSLKEIKAAIFITTLFTLAVAGALIYISFGSRNLSLSLLFLLLGIAAIVAAITYTVGKAAYGYRALGDVFVFIFFGLVSVAGSYFLYTQQLNGFIFLPAATVGFWSVAVLNLNNMRDRESDARAGKNTLAVLLGEWPAKYYHLIIVLLGMITVLLYTFHTRQSVYEWLYLIAFFPLLLHLRRVFKNTDPKTLDPELKTVALSTFLFALLFLLGKGL